MRGGWWLIPALGKTIYLSPSKTVRNSSSLHALAVARRRWSFCPGVYTVDTESGPKVLLSTVCIGYRFVRTVKWLPLELATQNVIDRYIFHVFTDRIVLTGGGVVGGKNKK